MISTANTQNANCLKILTMKVWADLQFKSKTMTLYLNNEAKKKNNNKQTLKSPEKKSKNETW